MKKSDRGSAAVAFDEAPTDLDVSDVMKRLPADMGALLDVAAGAVRDINAAITSSDPALVKAAEATYTAVVRTLLEWPEFAVSPYDGRAQTLVTAHCRAAPGTAPNWGQSGEYVLALDGMRILVKVEDGIRLLQRRHASLYVVDLDRAFISETGYRSVWIDAKPGSTLAETIVVIVNELQRTHRRYLLREHHERAMNYPLPDWTYALEPRPFRGPPVSEDEQLYVPPDGSELVDVLLTPWQAFQARRWAACHGSSGAVVSV